MSLPGGAQLINTHEDLLTAFTNIDQRLHRIIGGNDPPYIYRNKLYLPCSMYSIKLGAIGSSGERVGPQGALGQDAVVEDNSAAINADTGIINAMTTRSHHMDQPLSRGPSSQITGTTASINAHHRIEQVPFTLSGGVLADVEIVPALASYKGHMRVWALNADSADTYILTPQDEDNAALSNITLDAVIATAGVPVDLHGMLFYSSTAAKALEIDISGGAGAEKGHILVEWWYEP